MNDYPRRRFYFWLGLLCITVLYSIYYLYFIYKVSEGMPLKARHIGKFIFILLAYGTGAFTLKKQGPPWTLSLWRLVYGGVMLILLLLGIYDWSVQRASLDLRILAYDLQEILVSPILYVAIALIRGTMTVMR